MNSKLYDIHSNPKSMGARVPSPLLSLADPMCYAYLDFMYSIKLYTTCTLPNTLTFDNENTYNHKESGPVLNELKENARILSSSHYTGTCIYFVVIATNKNKRISISSAILKCILGSNGKHKQKGKRIIFAHSTVNKIICALHDQLLTTGDT